MADKKDRFVGPVIKAGEMADAVKEAVQEDNADREIKIEEHSSYVRIMVMNECVVRLTTVSECLGRSIGIGDIEINMPGFSGFIRTQPDEIRFLANTRDR